MDTKQKLDQALKDAMRAHDEMRKQNVRLVMSAIKLSEVEKGTKLDDAGVINVILKEIKARQETVQDAVKANRPELAEQAKTDMAFLETFLPQQLTEQELTDLVSQTINEVGAVAPSDMGKVMKALLPKIQGRATNDMVSQTVRKLLQK
jgi:uncharacterized protein YqeY